MQTQLQSCIRSWTEFQNLQIHFCYHDNLNWDWMEAAENPELKKIGRRHSKEYYSDINKLDDGCLMLIFSFLSPIPDRYNTALVCHRWRFLACHPRLWLRVDRFVKDLSQSGVYPNIETAVSAARPGDTILIAAGGIHRTSNIQIKKPICLIGAGEHPDDTTLICSRGSDSALELFSTCKLANLTVRAELGCCLLHRSGRLTIDGCILQCESNPLDHLSHAIVTTADGIPPLLKNSGDRVIAKFHGICTQATRVYNGSRSGSRSITRVVQRLVYIYRKMNLYIEWSVKGGSQANPSCEDFNTTVI
ncbi:hypothetical protein BUALT_Bualt19G0049600 [Buddleja alternifolia]|uniref:F-box domain-containing protein n=1 Tax=Buddleja alternifolia TaxID=168488 RepID=A0AAV6W294_9LAMI|nr:hypothetical protein BUALT_Bualt19G0049600 [Buddleja alternifolia]